MKRNATVPPVNEVKPDGENSFQWEPSLVENNSAVQNKYALLQSTETGQQPSVSETRAMSPSLVKYSTPPVPVANNTKLIKQKTKLQQLDDEVKALFNVCKSGSDAKSFVDVSFFFLYII